MKKKKRMPKTKPLKWVSKNTKVTPDMNEALELLAKGTPGMSAHAHQQKAFANYVITFDANTLSKQSVIPAFEVQQDKIKAEWQ